MSISVLLLPLRLIVVSYLRYVHELLHVRHELYHYCGVIHANNPQSIVIWRLINSPPCGLVHNLARLFVDVVPGRICLNQAISMSHHNVTSCVVIRASRLDLPSWPVDLSAQGLCVGTAQYCIELYFINNYCQSYFVGPQVTVLSITAEVLWSLY